MATNDPNQQDNPVSLSGAAVCAVRDLVFTEEFDNACIRVFGSLKKADAYLRDPLFRFSRHRDLLPHGVAFLVNGEYEASFQATEDLLVLLDIRRRHGLAA